MFLQAGLSGLGLKELFGEEEYDEFCIQHDELCIQNDEFCMKNRYRKRV